MLTPNGDLCLIDFNISLVLDGDDAGALGVSHGYASPEQYGPQGLPHSKTTQSVTTQTESEKETLLLSKQKKVDPRCIKYDTNDNWQCNKAHAQERQQHYSC